MTRVRIKTKSGEELGTALADKNGRPDKLLNGDTPTQYLDPHTIAVLGLIIEPIEPIEPEKKPRLLAWRNRDGTSSYYGQVIWMPEPEFKTGPDFERVPHLDEPEDK